MNVIVGFWSVGCKVLNCCQELELLKLKEIVNECGLCCCNFGCVTVV